MKKLILVFGLLLITHLCNSQNLSVGLHYGSNSSKINGDYGYKNLNNSLDYNAIKVPIYGIFLNYALNKNFAIQPELNFKTRGFKYNIKQGFVGGGYLGNAELKYIDVPVLLNYSYGKKLKIILNAGPSINFLVSGGKFDYSVWPDYPPFETKYYSRDIKQDFTKVGFSAIAGIGLKYEINARLSIFSEYRMNFGISKATVNKEYADANQQDTWYYNNTPFKDNSFEIGLQYSFKKIK